jgi:hypothetical protein
VCLLYPCRPSMEKKSSVDCRYATKNYAGFLNVDVNRKRLAQATVEIIQEYQQRTNAEKLAELAATTEPTPLPGGIILEGVDTKCLSLPFPVEAILPTTRLIFAELKNQVRFALSDKQINSISTGRPPLVSLLCYFLLHIPPPYELSSTDFRPRLPAIPPQSPHTLRPDHRESNLPAQPVNPHRLPAQCAHPT